MKNTYFNELAKRAFENDKAKGFHDKPLTDAHCIMLVACELADILICCMTELFKRGVDVDIIVDAKLAFNEIRK